MKKIFLVVFCLLLANICFARDISNKRGLIFQALDSGALGYICPKWAICKDDCRMGQFVYFDFNYDFVDGQMFNIPKNTYFYPSGVYKYTNREGITKTVRRIYLMSK